MAAALVFLLACPYALVGSEYPDEFTLLGHGMRVLQGQVIYRDFFEFITPLTSYLAAAVCAFTGPSLLALRLATAAMIAAASWGLMRLTLRLGPTGWWTILPAFLLGTLYGQSPGYSHHWIVQPFLIGTLALAVSARNLEAFRPHPWLLAGVLNALALLTLQSDGAALTVGLGAWFVLDAVLGPAPWHVVAKRAGSWLAGLLVGLLPVGLALAPGGALGAAVADTWFWPSSHYRTPGGINDVRYMTDIAGLLTTVRPHFHLWLWYPESAFVLTVIGLPLLLALITCCHGAMLFAARVRQGARWTDAEAMLALVALVALALFGTLLRGRADYTHDLTNLPIAACYATVLAWHFRNLLAVAGLPYLRWMPLGYLVLFASVGMLGVGDHMINNPDQRPRRGGPDPVFRADPVVQFIRSHTLPGDRIAVNPWGGEYYIYGAPPATRFTMILPPSEGYTDAAENETFWHEVTTAPAKLVLVTSREMSGPPPKLPVPGYRLETTITGSQRRTFVYSRDATR